MSDEVTTPSPSPESHPKYNTGLRPLSDIHNVRNKILHIMLPMVSLRIWTLDPTWHTVTEGEFSDAIHRVSTMAIKEMTGVGIGE